MTNDIPTPDQSTRIHLAIGSRLKAARESLGLERKNVALQLRLSESIIKQLEEDNYPENLPHTFLRGYVRAYGKLVGIPQEEIDLAIEPIKLKPVHQEPLVVSVCAKPSLSNTNYYMQFFSFFILVTMFSLVGVWWYKHTPHTASFAYESKNHVLPAEVNSANSGSLTSISLPAATNTNDTAPSISSSENILSENKKMADITQEKSAASPPGNNYRMLSEDELDEDDDE